MDEQYRLSVDFKIDSDGYTDRDRQMFGAGYEFANAVRAIIDGESGTVTVSGENMSRVRMFAGSRGVRISFERVTDDGAWWGLFIHED